MGTDINTRNEALPTIRLYAQSLEPQERFKHRAWIGIRVEALLLDYWRERPSDAVRAEIMGDWMEALENFSPEEIRKACRDYLNGPDHARKPKPGDLRDLMHKDRALVLASRPKPYEPPRALPPVEERRKVAAEVLSQHGFNPKRMGDA